MPKSEKIASGAEFEEPQTDSVFDFLYSDSARIASLLAQFDNSGHVTGAETSESKEEAQGDKISAEGHIGAKKLFGIGAGYEGNTGLRAGLAAKLTYDPYWANARNLLNLLDDRLVRDLSAARIGQIVAATGHLAITDTSILKQVWDMAALKEVVRASIKLPVIEQPTGQPTAITNQKPPKLTPAEIKQRNDAADATMAIMKSMPHLIQVRLHEPTGAKLWGTLRDSGVVGTTSDFLLKHGMVIPGQWAILGILDALPEAQQGGGLHPDLLTDILRGIQMVKGPFGDMFRQINLPVRQLLGRPLDHYGITPLLIFREVGHAGI